MAPHPCIGRNEDHCSRVYIAFPITEPDMGGARLDGQDFILYKVLGYTSIRQNLFRTHDEVLRAVILWLTLSRNWEEAVELLSVWIRRVRSSPSFFYKING